jgi:transposase-like protein
MDLLKIFRDFETQDQAIRYLEAVRWAGHPVCPYCKSTKAYRHGNPGTRLRWQCNSCCSAFSVTVGTIFHGTHIPLKNWLLLLALMLNAKKSASAYQIARDLGMRRPTVWSMMHRVRVAMDQDQKQAGLLCGILEADETYVGSKPRKANRRSDDVPSKRGRGTSKAVVVGVVERLGRVVAEPIMPSDLNSKGLHSFLKRYVDPKDARLMTDEYPGYRRISQDLGIEHQTVNHQIEYVNGAAHTNTIEGFWSGVKRAWYGQHHHYSPKYLWLYISEACYKYNRRKDPRSFDHILMLMLVR